MSWWQATAAAALAALAFYALMVGALVLAGRRETARALARFVPDCIVLFRRLVSDPRVPRRTKLLLGALIGYLALPFDLVPDFIPVAGYLDDAVIVALVLRHLLRTSGADLIEEHWQGAPGALAPILRFAGHHPEPTSPPEQPGNPGEGAAVAVACGPRRPVRDFRNAGPVRSAASAAGGSPTRRPTDR